MTHLMVGFAGFLAAGATVKAQEVKFAVRHDHAIRSCLGELIFGDTAVEYRTAEKKHARVWSYEDIQQVGLLGPRKISILTYEDSRWKLGKDRDYRFEVIDGEITPALWTMLQSRLTRPLVSSIIPMDIAPRFAIPVKHVRRFGGTQGALEISEEYVIYRTEVEGDSRVWRYRDISSVGTTGLYQLRVTTMDRVDGEFGSERNFVFSLKRALEPEIYDFLWWKINGPHISSYGRK
jgi:hypothetical protein